MCVSCSVLNTEWEYGTVILFGVGVGFLGLFHQAFQLLRSVWFF